MHTLKALQDGQITVAELGSEQRLKLSEGLDIFPREVFQFADHLEVLDMSGNNLSSLPHDFGRFKNLKILFLSNNKFDQLPEVIADCPKLEMIGFKANQIRVLPEDSLPIRTHWLILTENKIESLPDSMGKLTHLKKLALAGNKLTSLPESMANCRNLELIRLSANSLMKVPDWLLQLPKLSWLALSGNPVTAEYRSDEPSVETVKLSAVQINHQLGEGASGVISHGSWNNDEPSKKNIAIKLFKGAVTSDGYPEDELKCCLAAGRHENLINVTHQINQPGQLGLVMELIPPSYRNLGMPPSLATCTRDTFHKEMKISVYGVVKTMMQMTQVLQHMHANDVSHGDVYAHNTMVNDEYRVLFGDFGAATNLSGFNDIQKEAFELIEVRALGCMLEDLLPFIDTQCELYVGLSHLASTCMDPDLALRPRLHELAASLENLNQSVNALTLS